MDSIQFSYFYNKFLMLVCILLDYISVLNKLLNLL